MTPTEPPKIARWLLAQFGCSSNNATVIGDLDEHYRNGRSATWYYRQVAIAIVVSFVSEVRSHKWLTLRALVTGWGVFVVSRYGFDMTRRLLFALAIWSRLWRHNWIITVPPEAVLSGILAGWLVARLHRQNQKAMVLAYAAYFAGARIVWLVTALLRGTSFQTFIYAICFITITPVTIVVSGGVFGSRRDGDGSERTSATVY